MIEIINYDEKYINELVRFINENKDDYLKEFNLNSFVKTFIENKYFDIDGTKILLLNKKIIGFVNAVVLDNNFDTPGFITIILVEKKQRKKGYGKILFNTAVAFLKRKGKKYIRNYFLNPINLSWYIPYTNKHEHPNLPAIKNKSTTYVFYKKQNFEEDGIIDAYYLNIKDFKVREEVVELKKNLENKNIKVGYYQKEHYGFDNLFEDLSNQNWKENVQKNLLKDNPDPMIVVTINNLIIGWCGSVYNTESKRGNFSGIGISPKYQGIGLGKVLFQELIISLKNDKAEYMSLFTGRNNVAKNIYLTFGFKIVSTFTIMKKEI